MFVRAEIPKWQALSLFDKYREETPEAFRRILADHGWYQAHVPGSARIFMKDDTPAVFKFCEESIMWQGYDAFARRLRQPDVVPEDYPNLPHIYRYRDNVALLKRYETVSSEVAEHWFATIMAVYRFPDPSKVAPDIQDLIVSYHREYPYLAKALTLIRSLAVGHPFGFSTKAVDILSGEKGPILLDPLH